ncbi:MAG: N-acetylmuramoyl-L-alanine amidase, partial [Hyphococcus sp.]
EGRLVVDFANLTVGASARNFKKGAGHIARYGFAAGPGDTTRAVLEFKKTAKIDEVFIIPPKGSVAKHRLVIDLETADKSAFLASLPNMPADMTALIRQATAAPEVRENVEANAGLPPTPSRKAAPAAEERQRKVVVIDPGHGGRDPGAQGQSGTYEKTVTLAAALKLSEILKARGDYDVVLTRQSDSDPKIKRSQSDELARREELARKAGADLFISLHADALNQKNIRGASVYTLSEQGTARSANKAKSEGDYVVYNLNLEQWDQVVSSIMLDKAQDETNTASSNFAEILVEKLAGKTPMLNRSHRTGNLRVLLAPDVPAVLLEMAFISNAKDEANLNSPVWRERAMTAVADAIDQYFDEFAGRRFAANRLGASR